jgi:hypothetical protein
MRPRSANYRDRTEDVAPPTYDEVLEWERTHPEPEGEARALVCVFDDGNKAPFATAAPSLPENLFVAYHPDDADHSQMWDEDYNFSMIALRPAKDGEVDTYNMLPFDEAQAFWARQGLHSSGLTHGTKLDKLIAILNDNKGTPFEVYAEEPGGTWAFPGKGMAVVYAV